MKNQKYKIQGVQTLSDKSNLIVLLIQNWSFYDSLGSVWPPDVRNLYKGFKKQMAGLIPPQKS